MAMQAESMAHDQLQALQARHLLVDKVLLEADRFLASGPHQGAESLASRVS